MHILIADTDTLFCEAVVSYISGIKPDVCITVMSSSVCTAGLAPIDIAIVHPVFRGMPGIERAGKIIDPSEGINGRLLFRETEQGRERITLSQRERDVVPFILRGASNKEIAAQLDVSMASVKLYVRTLCRKLGAANRTQAALRAQDMFGKY